MSVSYKKLFDVLDDKGWDLNKLQEKAHMTNHTKLSVKRNIYIPLPVLEKVCKTLKCSLDDILEFVPDELGEYDESFLLTP